MLDRNIQIPGDGPGDILVRESVETILPEAELLNYCSRQSVRVCLRGKRMVKSSIKRNELRDTRQSSLTLADDTK